MNALRSLRLASAVEGASLLLLLMVAMPLKYGLGLALAVRVAGTLHGLLFLVLLSAASRAYFERAVSARSLLRVLGLSLVPLGFLAAERLLRRDADGDRSTSDGPR
ncbi:hypothetical protein BE17_51660 [Sorangium cellulosum]|uniref:DUF3817 domain-containing protein n=1 Tax=Sorangium cellulosum TaxID=56 RepID=A0A150RVI8_SORCE|nr:hypothetical protein BE17_51660 [Sorangium cellulosum]